MDFETYRTLYRERSDIIYKLSLLKSTPDVARFEELLARKKELTQTLKAYARKKTP